MTDRLTGRALEFLQQHGPSRPEELARYVFGGEGFAALLPGIAHPGMRFDGSVWSIAEPSQEVAFLQILTSGPNPRKHRMVEVAAWRDRREFHAFVEGPAPVPSVLQRLGVPAVPDALPMSEVGPGLRTFLAGAVVAGYGLDEEFVDQLLGPGWPTIDVLRLVFSWTSFSGKPEPMRLARHFGLPAPANRRPRALLKLCRALYPLVSANHEPAEIREAGRPRRPEVTVAPEVDHGPGVYIMADAEGQPLYVGKSVDLRRRVDSYLGSAIAESRGLYHLLELTDRVEAIPVRDDVEALLLESELIQRWLPPFNVQRAQRDGPRYLRLSLSEPFPRLTLASLPCNDGATYFGPLRHATAAERLRSLLQEVLRLRTCRRRLPPQRKPEPACELAANGRCLAPCVIGPPSAPYGAEVQAAMELLSADASTFRKLLLRLLRERPPSRPQALRIRRKFRALARPAAHVSSETPEADDVTEADGADLWT